MRKKGAVAIELAGVTKKYGDFKAVDGLDLRVMEGEVFGLLGPNGAGKTTTILMMLGLTEPTAGRVRVAGLDATRQPLEVKKLVGYLPENVGFYEEMTARENLAYVASLNGISKKEAGPRIDDLLGRVGLAQAADQRAGNFSRGMRQRLGIADVLVKSPRLVVLDEPTLGIDPDGARQVLDLIVRMSRREGITVLLSSHLLHQVQEVCDRVGIFVQGKMVAVGPIQSLGQQLADGGGMTIELQAEPLTAELSEQIRRLKGVESVEAQGDMVLVRCRRDLRGQIVELLLQGGASLQHLRLRGLGLEDIYMKYFRGE